MWPIFFLLELLWLLIKAIWWIVLLILISGWILSHTRDWMPMIKRHYKAILFFVGSIAVLIVIVWGLSSTQSDVEIAQNSISTNSITAVPIDTAQIIADQRKDSIFDGNIFAGLCFGISKGEYKRRIQKFKREYDNKIVFPDEKGNVLSYSVSWIEPQFYRGKLYEVEVKIDSYHAYYELEPVFERKYGITKYNHWEWQNAEIELSSISPHSESVYDPTSGTGERYDIKKPGYTTIRYKDLILYNFERREQMQIDSIKEAKEQVAREQRRQREREKADKYKENI